MTKIVGLVLVGSLFALPVLADAGDVLGPSQQNGTAPPGFWQSESRVIESNQLSEAEAREPRRNYGSAESMANNANPAWGVRYGGMAPNVAPGTVGLSGDTPAGVFSPVR